MIPVFNCERFLGEAIQSVLRQEHRRLEIIVVDDGSIDSSHAVAESFDAVRCIRQSNRGISAARNVGIEEAQGELLAFLDADDLWTDRKLELQLGALRQHPESQIIAGRVEQFYETNLPVRGISLARAGGGYTPGAMLIRRADFLRVGLFDEKLRLGDLMDWHSRAMELGFREYLLGETVLRRRIHDANTTRSQKELRNDYLSSIRAHLQRQRRAA